MTEGTKKKICKICDRKFMIRDMYQDEFSKLKIQDGDLENACKGFFEIQSSGIKFESKIRKIKSQIKEQDSMLKEFSQIKKHKLGRITDIENAKMAQSQEYKDMLR